jgi:hypothetical protein
MTKPHIFREGDRIRILRTRIISRVGYDLIPAMFIEEAKQVVTQRAVQQALGLTYHHHSARVIDRLASALTFAMVADKGFGSNKRSLHYKPVVGLNELHFGDATCPLEGTLTTVEGKHVAYTGERVGPYSSQSYEGEWDYDPGGLNNRQTHIILHTPYGWIETCDVELVA